MIVVVLAVETRRLVFVVAVVLAAGCIQAHQVLDTLAVGCKCKEKLAEMGLSSRVTRRGSAMGTNCGGRVNPSLQRKEKGGQRLSRGRKEQDKTGEYSCFCCAEFLRFQVVENP